MSRPTRALLLQILGAVTLALFVLATQMFGVGIVLALLVRQVLVKLRTPQAVRIA